MCKKDLYEFAIKALDDEQSRSTRIDQKSSTYITVISVFLGGFGFSWKWIYDQFIPPSTCIEIASIILGCLLFLSLCTTWVLLSICLMQRSIKHLRTKYEQFYKIGIEKGSDVYYQTIAVSAIAPLTEAISLVNNKSSWLHKSYISLAINFIFLVLLIVTIAIQSFEDKKNELPRKNVVIVINTDDGVLRLNGDLKMNDKKSEESLLKKTQKPDDPKIPQSPPEPEAPLPDHTPPDIVPVPLDPLPEGNEPGTKEIIMEDSKTKK